MAEIHVGTMTTLASVAIAGINNGDVAYVWHSSWQRKMVFDSTATDATDTTNHPYAQRPSDFGAGPGVWIEAVGALENQVFNANQIITGQLRSTNCTTATGSQYDLDNATIKLGGTQVDAAGSYLGAFLGLDSGTYKFYVGDGSTKYFNFDGTNISWRGVNTELTTAGLFSASRIVATGGTIGSFTIGTYLYTGSKTAYNDANAGIHLGSDGIGIGNNIFTVSSAGALVATNATISGAITAATIDIGGDDTSSFHVDISGGIWSGASIANKATAPFRVSSAGALVATSASIIGAIYASTGTIANWAIAANYLTSINIGLHSASAASGAQILIGHATSYASAKIGLKNDGSGKLADGKIYWDASGNITLDVPANAGTGVGIIYKGTKRWLYDFNPATNASGITPNGLNTFLGVEAGNLTMGDTAIVTGHSSYNVGIGYQVLYSNTIGLNNVGIGYQVLYSNTTGYSNVGIGHQVLYSNTAGYGNVGIGDYAGRYQSDGGTSLQTPENSIYIGQNTISGSDPTGGEDAIANEIVIGYVAIGKGSNSIKLGNTGITKFHCQVALTVDSDERIKRNINPSLIGLSFINALNPITFQPKNPFDYPDKIKPFNFKDRIIKEKDKEGKEVEKLIKADKRPPDNDKTYLGLTAQQVEEVMTIQGIDAQLVTTSNQGKKAITYGNLIMPLITAVQELSQKVEVLENKLN